MARRRKKTRKEITNYAHTDEQRVNNPPVGLVTPDTDKDAGKKSYAYDPHLDPRMIVEAVRRQNGFDQSQLSLFSLPEENTPLRQAIEFYRRLRWPGLRASGAAPG